ncbi:MAG TPA: hypothetical protein VNZ26_13380 [Vicinamibacterales bacterium]|nr:hypothetical protein [Vicinamibacterales bacterium]
MPSAPDGSNLSLRICNDVISRLFGPPDLDASLEVAVLEYQRTRIQSDFVTVEGGKPLIASRVS